MLAPVSATSVTLLALGSLAAAQTYTSCDPTKTTCPADAGLTSTSLKTDFTKGESTSWKVADGTTLSYSDFGAEFTIKTSTDAPTISTNFYVFFGYIEVKMRAAPGTGIVSSIVLESDDLDEIDWEFLGGNNTSVETNFFGKGNTTAYDRAIYYPVTTPTDTFHTYAVNWTSSSLTWLIDGTPVRTLAYDDTLALNGKNYPQTPCQLKLGSWVGGASSSPGTVAWAGGAPDFSAAPFVMYVESVSITNYNPASSYTYGDKSGDFGSIKLEGSTGSEAAVSGGATGALLHGASSNSSAALSLNSTTTSASGVGAMATTTVVLDGTSTAGSTLSAPSATVSTFRSGSSSVRWSTSGLQAGVSAACFLTLGLVMTLAF